MVENENLEEPHDVLAAEEFALGAEALGLHAKAVPGEPHDVLAADEFELPAPDPALHHENLAALPPDLAGSDAQEILAAEEFAMPSPEEAHVHGPGCEDDRKVIDLRMVAAAVGAGALLTLIGLRRIRRRSAARAVACS